MSQPKSEFDTPWKKVLDIYFEDFVAYCWPEQHSKIDWKKGYKSLDKELSKISRNAPVTNRIVDKLVEVYLKNGDEAYVLIHIEVQGQSDVDFEKRMFIYRLRLRDLHDKPIASLAVLIDADQNWRPGVYREELWGSSMEMKFPIIKLIDYKSRVKELEASTNPFSSVILAQLATLEKQSPEAKLTSKINLIKWLYTRNWKREDIMTLLTFMDWVFALPKQLELKCKEIIEGLEEELHVDYVTSFERMGIEKGEGTMLLCFLEGKFKNVPDNYLQKINKADAETLVKWGKRVLNSQSLDEVFND
ncbi:MAG TPA: cytosolic protein [Gammaproteobacteria bacterium]|nr:cytosolic protein [Gammaproteobacteria bacterium]